MDGPKSEGKNIGFATLIQDSFRKRSLTKVAFIHTTEKKTLKTVLKDIYDRQFRQFMELKKSDSSKNEKLPDKCFRWEDSNTKYNIQSNWVCY